tara:strand:+ start:39 stop:830 length:792 start_codon:yes stop_codon:yes gene_type:complete
MSRLVLWFSCGAASATACKIALNDKDLLSDFDEVVIAYCRVREEHEDNMRFLKDCEKWFQHEIIILEHEKYKGSIYNVFEKNYMRTPSGSPCTRALKKQVRDKWQHPDDTHMFGYTLEEEKRAKDFETRNNTLKVEWVLIDNNITKNNCLAMVHRAGIELPIMYKLGYEHNNCVGCVKGGMGYWNKIRKDFPEAFERMSKFERRKGYTVLKEPKTGKPLYLDTLNPNRGRLSDEPKIECGIACEVVESKYNDNLIHTTIKEEK